MITIKIPEDTVEEEESRDLVPPWEKKRWHQTTRLILQLLTW
jgi:hypothetical protein